MKKIITLVLAVLMLFSVVACAQASNNQNNGDGPSSSVEEKKWDKKEFDFEGYVFNILGTAPSGNIAGWDGIDIDCEELTGNEVLDAVYNRNRLIESTYNCVIDFVDAINLSSLKNLLMAGNEDDVSMISRNLWDTFSMLEESLLFDLNDPAFTNLDLSQDWYSQSMQRDTSVAGRLYFIAGDMLFSDDNGMWITLFNKALAEQYITDIDLYDAVKNGTWTIDTLMKYSALAAKELEVNDKMDHHDQWGYVGEGPNVLAILTAAGYHLADITPDGGIQHNVYNSDFQEAFRKCYEIVDERYCIMATDITGEPSIWDAMDATFYEGRGLFMITSMSRALLFREMQTDFGILPLPKLKEEQAGYNTWSTYNSYVVSIPYTCANPERTSAIMEALFEESSYDLKNAYVEEALKYKTTRDDESIEMLDIIFANTLYDIGIVYNFGGTTTALANIVERRTIGALTSQLNKLKVSAASDIDKLLVKLGYKEA